jgi:hypothetical protein
LASQNPHVLEIHRFLHNTKQVFDTDTTVFSCLLIPSKLCLIQKEFFFIRLPTNSEENILPPQQEVIHVLLSFVENHIFQIGGRGSGPSLVA